MDSTDWNLWRAFLAVVESGSLSGAAKRTGTSQPTLSRQVRELEAGLGVILFARTSQGLEPTESALGMVEDARAMRAAAQVLALKAQGRAQALAGTVRITASVVVANLLLPPIIASLRQTEPLIQLELVASDERQNLLRRDADLAVRMVNPTQDALIARKLGETAIGLFGSSSYLDRRGRPRCSADLLLHDLVGLDRGDLMIRACADNGLAVTRDYFPVRCDDQIVSWHLLLAGAGLGFAQTLLGRREANLEQLDIGFRVKPLPVWLVLHEEVRTSARIRRVADILGDALEVLFRSPDARA